MDVRIGVTQTPKEILVELPDGTDQGVLWLTDRKGRRVGVPSAKLAYIEIGSPTEDRRVGFASRS